MRAFSLPVLIRHTILIYGTLTAGLMLLSGRAIAQVTPDGSLSTTVTQSGNNFTIDNGNQTGDNLFHSFGQFSVPMSGSAIFNNAVDVQNIFARVTGGSLSTIDGAIRANGTANLFLLNPSGILFGQNASLNIGGSFVGTTANSIKFADGTEFSAVNPTTTPLLTLSVPMGLQMGQTPGTITVQNTGHRLIDGNAPLQMGATPTGLRVTAGNTLALVGGDIGLEGGILSAPSGHLELGSAIDGTVNLTPVSTGWNFDYSPIQQFGDIHLSRQAFANASGAPAGFIQLQGRNISVNDGSVVFLNNQNTQASGTITVKASDSLEMRGVGTHGFAHSFLLTNATTGTGGNLDVNAPQILIQDGGKIAARAYSSGMAGNVSVAANSIQLRGFSSVRPATTRSQIVSETLGSGQGGNVQVTTQQLRLEEGSLITGGSRGTGAIGNVLINASKFIELTGENPVSFSASFIGAVSSNRGNVGNVTINTPRLSVLNAAVVGATTLGPGNAGILQVNVSEQTIVNGMSAASGKHSEISASASVLPLAFQQSFGISGLATGNSGDLIVNTPRLEISDGGVVRVNNQGLGNAGNLYINADRIALDRDGTISASTNSGTGGNINLQSNTLTLRHDSNIIATAGGTGNGGNIAIDSPIIIGLENSDIIANAFQGRGGNIDITTQGIIGLEFRNTLTPRNDITNDITASSESSVNGTVEIHNIGVNPNSGLVSLPGDLVDPTQQIAQGCAANQSSSFVATGRGGLPSNPRQQARGNHLWSDTRDLSAYSQVPATQTPPAAATAAPLIQATGWQQNAQGQVELLASAETSAATTTSVATCSAAT